MVSVYFLIPILFFGSFMVTYLVTPFLIKRMHFRKITGKDMNKYDKREVAEMGGISVIFGFSFAVMISIFVHTYLGLDSLNLTVLLAAFSTVILIGFIGVVDDLIGWRKGIRQWQHALFPLFAALPLMAVKIGFTEMTFPLFGAISFGIFYSLILIPIGITGASNAFNMLAGHNGLESLLGIVCFVSLLAFNLVSFIFKPTGFNLEAIIILTAMIGALAAFLKFNWHPAKIFPGDSLTLMNGALLAATVIIGNMEKIGIVLMALFFVELIFKARHRFQSECYGIPLKDGTLKARPEGGSLTQWVMRRGKFTEKQVVLIIVGMQVAVSILVALYFYLNFIGVIEF